MSIWRRTPDLQVLNERSQGSMVAHLDIRFTAVGDDFLEATMPVDHRTHQPFGLLHGGASVALAETICSTAGLYCLADPALGVLGMEINANHVRGVRSGLVTGRAVALHVGRTTQVWQCRIHDERDKLVCASRMTLAVAPRPQRQ